VLQGLASGQDVPTTLLSRAKADSFGRYSLCVSASALLNAAVDGSNATLEVDSATGEWFFDVDTTNPVMTPVDISTDPEPLYPCGPWTYRKQMARDWAAVGSSYIWTNSHGVTGTFQYQKSQSSSTGVALKITTSDTPPTVGYSADGTNSNSSATTIGFPTKGAGDSVEFKTRERPRFTGRCAFQHFRRSIIGTYGRTASSAARK
jgi:hypothetical protein